MKLVIEDEVGTRTVVPFTGGEIIVGRTAEGGGLRLADRDVSRRHARFLHVNGVASVEDLGSLTGTRVNGERITGRRRLREGDLIEIGGYDLAVVPDDGLAAVAGPGLLPRSRAPGRPPHPGLPHRRPGRRRPRASRRHLPPAALARRDAAAAPAVAIPSPCGGRRCSPSPARGCWWWRGRWGGCWGG